MTLEDSASALPTHPHPGPDPDAGPFDDDELIEGHHTRNVPISVGRHEFVVPLSPVSGAEIRQIAGVDPERKLFLVVDGPANDVVMEDDQLVEVRPGARFYSVASPVFG